MNLKQIISNLKKNNLTIMMIPSLKSSTKSISIPILYFHIFILFSFLIFGTAFFIISRHINYIATINQNILLENKLEYFSQELIKSRNFIAEVRDVDYNLRTLLEMDDKKEIINKVGVGGPEALDIMLSTKLLEKNKIIFSTDEFEFILNRLRSDAEKQISSSKAIFNYIDLQRQITLATPDVWPAPGRISSLFGLRIDPVKFTREFHKGLDIANREGTWVSATANGRVKYAGWLGGYGKTIVIDHGYGYITLYAHLSQINVVRGEVVKKFHKIGKIGRTGRATGAHLHYEVRLNNKLKNPMNYIKSRAR